MKLRIRTFSALALSIFAASCQAQAPARLSFDFNASNPWPQARYTTTRGVSTSLKWQAAGSYDIAGSKEQSNALVLSADATRAAAAWSADLASGPLAVATREANLGKLSLSFDLSASSARPVKVKLTSLSASGARGGALECLIYPAAPDFPQRFAFDLSAMKRSGAGTFSPTAPRSRSPLKSAAAPGHGARTRFAWTT